MENVFIEGIFIQKPHEKAPEWVKLNFSVDVQKFALFAEAHKNAKGYLNFDLKKSKDGKLYLALNTFEPKKSGGFSENEMLDGLASMPENE